MAEEIPATTHADLYQRHEPDPENWEEQPAVTGRPNDLTGEVANSTLAERAKARQKAAKAVEAPDENKAVQSATTKRPRRSKK